MNENLDLTKILKNCPKGWMFYSSAYGYVVFDHIDMENSIVWFESSDINNVSEIYHINSKGRRMVNDDGECIVFPDKVQRDWSNFTAPWYKREKFDPKILKHFDSVIVRSDDKSKWFCDSFSYVYPDFICVCTGGCEYKQCVPYNDETKHLVGTTDEAPEYYKYWED